MNSGKSFFADYYKKLHSEANKYGKAAGSERVNIIASHVGSGKTVVELGCRDGMLLNNLTEGNKVVGCDIDDIALAHCKKNFGINVCQTDLNVPLPFKDNAFDAVVAAEVIEHLVEPDYFVKEVSRILKESGIFLGTVPNAYRLKTRLEFLQGKPLTRDPSHLRFFNYDTLRAVLDKHFETYQILPIAGHIIGSHKLGIPVSEKTPLWLGKLVSGGFFWKAIKGNRD